LPKVLPKVLPLTIEASPPISSGYFKPWQLFARVFHIAKKINLGLQRARPEMNYVVNSEEEEEKKATLPQHTHYHKTRHEPGLPIRN